MADEQTGQTTGGGAPPATASGQPPAQPSSPSTQPPTSSPQQPAAEQAKPAGPPRGPDGKFLKGEQPADAKPAEGNAGQDVPPDYAGLIIPEQLQVVDDLLGEAKTLFGKHKLAPELAQSLIDLHAKVQLRQHDAWLAQQRQWQDATKSDPEIGGANLERTKGEVARAMALLRPQFREAVNELGVGDHPEFVRAFATLGRRLGEDRLVGGGRPVVSTAARLYPNTPQMVD